ncbi:GNAT family N-acetyltransferase [Roseibium sp.]|uniref:GNAT family N-acetyltransferase n=1 Tax=Roseibium sp. TaxID=1936156 RepID=UPI003A978370
MTSHPTRDTFMSPASSDPSSPVAAPAEGLSIREYRTGDLASLISMNNKAVPAVNDLSAEELVDQIAQARTCLVAAEGEALLGFLLCYAEKMDYDSRNYLWLNERLDRFFYTDRICVDEDHRGRRIGEKLYQALFAKFETEAVPFCCEVNTRPANPGSLRFHKRLGFEEIGEAEMGDKAVVYLKR